MNATERRDKILETLMNTEKPVSASAIAKEFGVSRQIIVGDIALLRASGIEIYATPRGYIMQTSNDTFLEKTIVCRHEDGILAEEIYIIVDNGGGLIDVTVEHSLYGEISAPLHIYSRYDADEFINKVQSSNSLPLCNLTDGIHFHKIRCPDEDCFDRITKQLTDKSILFTK